MHIMVGEKRCPSCGVRGEVWKRKPEVLVCPTCNSFFNEFGVVLESQIEKEEDQFT